MSDDLTIAENINTPADELVKLADTKYKKVLAAIAKNPNTLRELLLAGEYLYEIGDNPALNLILYHFSKVIGDLLDGQKSKVCLVRPIRRGFLGAGATQ